MKILYAIFWVVLLAACSKGKQPNNLVAENSDSLSIYLRTAKSDKTTEAGKSLNYKKAFNHVVNQKNDSLSRAKLLEIALGFFNKSQWHEFNKVADVLLDNSMAAKDTLNQAQVYRYKSRYYKSISVNDSSFYYSLKAEKLFKKLNDPLTLGSVLSYKSIVQYNIGDYIGADRSLTEAYKLLKDSKDYQKLYVVYTMMGVVSSETKDYKKGIEYYGKALEVIREHDLQDDSQESICLNNLGYLYQNKGDYSEAVKIYQLALKEKVIQNKDPELYSLLIDNLAYSNFKLKKLESLPGLFYESLKVRENIKATTLIILSKIHLSEFYAFKKDTLKAQEFAREALSLARSNGIPRDVLVSLKQYSNVDHKRASKLSGDYIRISDSINGAERLSKEKFARLELETDEIIQEKGVLEERNRNLLMTFAVVGIIVGLLFVVRWQRARTRELLYKQAQQKANEEIFNLMISQQAIIDESREKEKRRLAQDLHDGILGRMFGLRLNLDSLNSFNDNETVQRRQGLLNELKLIEQDIREISHDLNREKEELINNFTSILLNLLEEQQISHRSKLDYHADRNIDWDIVDNITKINIYRILQESLQNINKYAKAENVSVEIKIDGENLLMSITDNGVGFDVNKKSKGIGMQNMISRINECKGAIDIRSQKDVGTIIKVIVPLEIKQLIEK